MRVRCVKTALTEEEVGFEGLAYADRRIPSKSGEGFRHTFCDVGFESTVFAITSLAGHISYWLHDVRRPGSTKDLITYYPAPCFEVIDPRVTSYWVFKTDYIDVGPRMVHETRSPRTTFAIPEWINEPMFLENLVDGKERELGLMKTAIERMENEFDAVEETA